MVFEKMLSDGIVIVEYKVLRMQRTEVTQMQWMIVMGDNPSLHVKPDCPVEHVSWNSCQDFIKKLNEMDGANYRLPEEVEWEYACRAGATGYWGKRANGEEGPLDAMGWYGGDIGQESHPVAQKEPNAWGLYDMHGNVCEWTSTGGGGSRVYRGGSWNNISVHCAAGNRRGDDPDDRDSCLGFRLVSQDL